MVFAVTIAACLPHGVALAINLKLDLLESWIVGRLMAWINVVGMALVLLLLGLLTWRLSIYAGTLAAEKRTTVILRWPQAPFIYAMTALFAFCAFIQVVVFLNALLKALTYRTTIDKPESSALAWVFSLSIAVIMAALIVWGVMDFRSMSRLATANVGTTIAVFCSVMWLLLLFLVPLSAVMGLMGIVGAALFIGFNPSLSAFATEVSGFLTNTQIAVLPLFLMMGSFAAVAGIADDMYALAHALLSRFPGGLAMATIGGCAGFGAMTGSTVATAALVGRVALPKMAQHGYSPGARHRLRRGRRHAWQSGAARLGAARAVRAADGIVSRSVVRRLHHSLDHCRHRLPHHRSSLCLFRAVGRARHGQARTR